MQAIIEVSAISVHTVQCSAVGKNPTSNRHHADDRFSIPARSFLKLAEINKGTHVLRATNLARYSISFVRAT